MEKEKAPDVTEAGVLDLPTEDLREEICDRFKHAFIDFINQYPNAKFHIILDRNRGSIQFGVRNGKEQDELLLFDVKCCSISLQSHGSIPVEFRQLVQRSLLDFLK